LGAIYPIANYPIAKAGNEAGVTRLRWYCLVSTCLQDGQTKMSICGRTPSFGTVRRCSMVSPQEEQTSVGELSGTGRARPLSNIESVDCEFGKGGSSATGGSATELSATGAWRGPRPVMTGMWVGDCVTATQRNDKK
jgi:hypothetical protein